MDILKKVMKLENDAKEFGFAWESINQIIEQIQSECQEVLEAHKNNDKIHLQEEIGDLLHAAVCLAIFCEISPLEVLDQSREKLQKRYDIVVSLAKKDGLKDLKNQPLDVLMSYWNRAKKLL